MDDSVLTGHPLYTTSSLNKAIIAWIGLKIVLDGSAPRNAE